MHKNKVKLTIGMSCYDDFNGVYFTITGIRAAHKKLLDRIEFIVIDNNPTSKHGENTSRFCRDAGVKYIKYTSKKSTSVVGKIFDYASHDYVLGLDCHVIPDCGALSALIKFYEKNPNTKDLIHGPLVYDDNKNISTHLDPIWNDRFFGMWGTDTRGINPKSKPFEIPMSGMGLFSCRKDAWVGFCPASTGFGAGEGYIHEKFRQAGGKVLCLPALRWHHRFDRPDGIPYPNRYVDRYHNYMIGWRELNMDTTPIRGMFKDDLTEEQMDAIDKTVDKELTYKYATVNGVEYVLTPLDS